MRLLKVGEKSANAFVGVLVAAKMDAVNVPTDVAFRDGACGVRVGGRETKVS